MSPLKLVERFYFIYNILTIKGKPGVEILRLNEHVYG